MKFSGELFTYDQEKRLTAFESGPLESSKTVVFIGGLGDGYNAVPFLKPLSETLCKKNWSLVQVQLESSVNGYGTSCLQNDCDQLDSLVQHLKQERDKETIVFLGHSTGSQDCYWHNRNGKTNQEIAAYILQAPVSDREFFSTHLPEVAKYLDMSIRMRNENQGKELMPFDAMGLPITANRYFSLIGKGGDDDVFSTDLTDDELRQLYQGVDRPICWVYSEKDEYYASQLDQTQVMKRYQQFCTAIQQTHIVPSGDHSITNHDSQLVFCRIVDEFLDTLL